MCLSGHLFFSLFFATTVTRPRSSCRRLDVQSGTRPTLRKRSMFQPNLWASPVWLYPGQLWLLSSRLFVRRLLTISPLFHLSLWSALCQQSHNQWLTSVSTCTVENKTRNYWILLSKGALSGKQSPLAKLNFRFHDWNRQTWGSVGSAIATFPALGSNAVEPPKNIFAFVLCLVCSEQLFSDHFSFDFHVTKLDLT